MRRRNALSTDSPFFSRTSLNVIHLDPFKFSPQDVGLRTSIVMAAGLVSKKSVKILTINWLCFGLQPLAVVVRPIRGSKSSKYRRPFALFSRFDRRRHDHFANRWAAGEKDMIERQFEQRV